MVTAFAMRNFLKAAVGCLGMIAGCFSTGEAQDFGGMSFGEAGNFGPPQTSGSSKATVNGGIQCLCVAWRGALYKIRPW